MACIENANTCLGITFTNYYCNDVADNKGYLKKELMFNKTITPLVFVFLIFGACILVFRHQLAQYGFDWQMLSGSNLFIYVITVISMHLLTKGMNASNTHAFLRNAYSGILVKLFACAAAAFVYILVSGEFLNKPALLTSMGFYLVYSFVENYVILKESNRKKNAKS